MPSIKKQLITARDRGAEINTSDNVPQVEWADHACDHSLSYHVSYKLETDNWQYSRMFCPSCDTSWDAWQAPKQTDPPTYYHGFDGHWYPEPEEGDQHDGL